MPSQNRAAANSQFLNRIIFFLPVRIKVQNQSCKKCEGRYSLETTESIADLNITESL